MRLLDGQRYVRMVKLRVSHFTARGGVSFPSQAYVITPDSVQVMM